MDYARRAADLVSAELGPRPEHEIRSALERQVEIVPGI
jgi:hypothetical protein